MNTNNQPNTKMSIQFVVRTGADATSPGMKCWNVAVDGGPSYQVLGTDPDAAIKIVQGFEPNAPDSAFTAIEMEWVHGKGYKPILNNDQ